MFVTVVIINVTMLSGTTDSGGDICVQVKGCKFGSVGFVAPNVRIKIVNTKTGEVLGANEAGELRVKLPCVMNGYHKNPEATKRAFDLDGMDFDRARFRTDLIDNLKSTNMRFTKTLRQ